ncbi:hypothetical protein CAOG_06049 [Capsaspora owczarzaki ATCC 30864]|uniref:Methylosome subunit pICln n=1 Tax=Capsaspora owczarzaki (strain ATCC 30864) TaxID=595528 RepID=A0A0D2X484_CAPO3|nr:hypothetical protein CAOG_06049 [Capsaspora owczarzaki ATCC 30864]KJE95614.1 hypothetical protein CAOG_006049 [Capsaspora owczarzaki ATCC 30864]|eukprot:XP_004345639.1 hypothetical protein CAOG_06049 [Capsaspora owczarzaki ATCC 30864]
MVERISELPSELTRQYTAEGTQLFYQRGPSVGSGTLVVAHDALYWWNSAAGEGLSVPYPSIAIHAISTDPASFSQPCIYLQTDGGDDYENDDEDDDEGDGDGADGNLRGVSWPPSEVWLAPADPSSLQAIFEALSACQAMHPDQDASDDDEELDEEEAEARLDHLDSVFQITSTSQFDAMTDDRFDDAEDDGEEGAEDTANGDLHE